MATSDTAVLDQDTGLSMPETPPEEAAPEAVERTEGNVEAGAAPETAAPESTETLESQFDPDEVETLFESDPVLKASLEKKLQWERDKAAESFRQKRETEVEEAKRQAEAEAEVRQYQQSMSEFAEYYGGNAGRGFAAVLRKAAEEGLEAFGNDFNPEEYFRKEGLKLYTSAQAAIVSQTATTRIQSLAETYPEWKASPSLNAEWTKALTARDPRALDTAYMKAVAEAERQLVTTESEAKVQQAKAAKEAERAEEAKLTEAEQVRNSTARPTAGTPVRGRRLMTPEELDKIPMREWESYPQAKRDDLIAQVNEYRAKNNRKG